MYKKCTKCKEFLPLSEFTKDRQKSDGYYSSCYSCVCRSKGRKKRIHKIIGEYDGFKVVDGNPYPMVLGCRKEYGIQPRVHVFVMERKLGRKLKKSEHVHHIDGNKKNWDTQNLMVIDSSTHHSYESKLMWTTTRQETYKGGAWLNCKSCGKEKRAWKCYIEKKWKGDRERAINFYRCRDCRKVTLGVLV